MPVPQNSPARPDTEDAEDETLAAALPAGSRGRRLLKALRETRHKSAMLFMASFLETTVVPVPIEVVLIPYMVAERDKVWRIAGITLLGCLAGALLGYGIGYFLFETLGRQLVEWAGWSEDMTSFRDLFDAQGFWAILAVGILPIPFQVAMLAAGAAAYPLAWFALAAGLARGLRYYGLAWLVWRFGNTALRQWRKRKLAVSLAAAGLLALLWLGAGLLNDAAAGLR